MQLLSEPRTHLVLLYFPGQGQTEAKETNKNTRLRIWNHATVNTLGEATLKVKLNRSWTIFIFLVFLW